MWVFVYLHLTWLAGWLFLHLSSLTASNCLRIKDVDHVPKGVAILTEQSAQLFIKLHFRLDCGITFHSFQLCELLSELLLQASVFGET
ncbi:hypothetical protein D3C76_1671200 [compost metagenome]